MPNLGFVGETLQCRLEKPKKWAKWFSADKTMQSIPINAPLGVVALFKY